MVAGGYQQVARSAIANPSVASSTSNPKISQIHTERDKSASEKFPAALLAFFRGHYQFRLVHRIQSFGGRS